MFTCTQCGLCCKNISHIEELKSFDRGDGTCKYLDISTNICTIYEQRPSVCNVEKMYEYYKDKYTLEVYYILNTKSCNYLQEKFINTK